MLEPVIINSYGDTAQQYVLTNWQPAYQQYLAEREQTSERVAADEKVSYPSPR